jgi:hypothetical protein
MMAVSTNEFPEKSLLWPGAILGSIAHAIFVCRCPELAHEQSWDGTNYNVQDSAGSRGTIAFSGSKIVGVFFHDGSDRNPLRTKSTYKLDKFFAGLPADLKPLANEEALPYVLQEINGATVPIITSAFWADGRTDRITAAEPWASVLEHGAVLVKNQLLSPDIAITRWAAEYDLKPSQVMLAQALFERKMADPGAPIELNGSERSLLKEMSDDPTGIAASQECFEEIGILIS